MPPLVFGGSVGRIRSDVSGLAVNGALYGPTGGASFRPDIADRTRNHAKMLSKDKLKRKICITGAHLIFPGLQKELDHEDQIRCFWNYRIGAGGLCQ